MIQSLRSLGRVSSVSTGNLLRSTIILTKPTLVQHFSTTQPTFDRIVAPKVRVPPPTETIPDVAAFLNTIGRNTVEHADNFETWESLMTLSSEEMKEKGIDTRSRRYILSWREKFAKGEQIYEIKRGKKSWGGERRRKAFKAVYLAKHGAPSAKK